MLGTQQSKVGFASPADEITTKSADDVLASAYGKSKVNLATRSGTRASAQKDQRHAVRTVYSLHMLPQVQRLGLVMATLDEEYVQHSRRRTGAEVWK